MIGMLAMAIFLGRVVSLTFLGVVAFLALKEYLSVIPTRRAEAMSLSLLKFVGQASLVDDAMLPS